MADYRFELKIEKIDGLEMADVRWWSENSKNNFDILVENGYSGLFKVTNCVLKIKNLNWRTQYSG